MIDFIKKLLGIAPAADFAALLKEGAIILDVRSKAEFSSGSIPGAVNIPLDALKGNLSRLKDHEKPIITCCASGMRSAAAKSLLKANGYRAVYNGGGWTRLKSKINKI